MVGLRKVMENGRDGLRVLVLVLGRLDGAESGHGGLVQPTAECNLGCGNTHHLAQGIGTACPDGEKMVFF